MMCSIILRRKGIQMAHWGSCTNLTSPERCGAVQKCPEDESSDEPVCGSDGNVYRCDLLLYLSNLVKKAREKLCKNLNKKMFNDFLACTCKLASISHSSSTSVNEIIVVKCNDMPIGNLADMTCYVISNPDFVYKLYT